MMAFRAEKYRGEPAADGVLTKAGFAMLRRHPVVAATSKGGP
jgi:hypothetical protein